MDETIIDQSRCHLTLLCKSQAGIFYNTFQDCALRCDIPILMIRR